MTKHIITGLVFVIVVGLAFVFLRDTNDSSTTETQDATKVEQVTASKDAPAQEVNQADADAKSANQAEQAEKPQANKNKVIESEYTGDDTSEISLDWEGFYQGVLPCASCSGIKTSIKLLAGNRFTIEEDYLGKDFKAKDEGEFIWLEGGSDIVLIMKSDKSEKFFKVMESGLALLNSEGRMVEKDGEWDTDYILNKVEN